MKAKSDRLLAAGIAVLVCLVIGYAVTSRPVAHQAVAPSAFDAQPSKAGGSGWRTAFL